MSDRDEILVNFQAFTGIEDIATCYDILEQKGWDLPAAVNSVLPQEADPGGAASVDGGLSVPQVDLTGDDQTSPVVDLTHSPTVPSPPQPLASMPILCCDLGVYYGGRRIPVQLPAAATVKQLKELLEGETGIPVPDQSLTGWPETVSVSDESRLADIGLAEKGVYHLRLERDVIVVERPAELRVRDSEGHRGMVRVDLISPPAHGSTPSSPSSSSHYSDAQESLGEGEAIDDSLFTVEDSEELSQRSTREPLIPEGCTEPVEALTFFTQRFEERYGAMHPLFFIGSLSDAVKEATGGTPLSGTRRPLFIYIHHDGSILSNIFCSQLLCTETIVNYLSSNFITWAWDLTAHPHRVKVLEMVQECFGAMAKASVDGVSPEQLPAILLAYKTKGTLNIRNIVQGETNLDALMSTLISAVDEHQFNLDQESAEERDRLARERMIEAQDRAYHESLMADQEKERQRLMEEEQRQELERAEELEKQEREATMKSMEDSIPPEPDAESGESMSTLRLRFPDGSVVQRRFLASHRLQDVINLIGSKGYWLSDYKLITRAPRGDLSEQDPSRTLEDSGLCPQQMIFIEER